MESLNNFIVDEYCSIDGKVLINNNIAYSCLLNQTNIDTNKNKYYIMQIINLKNIYYLYIRFGRVSERGRILIKKFITETEAISNFFKKFELKTGKIFGSNVIVKKSKKQYYTIMESNLLNNKINENINPTISKLQPRQLFLMKLISNTKFLADTLTSFSIDQKKMPLGLISIAQLLQAENILLNIKELVDENNIDNKNKIIELSSIFYTLVPCSCGRKKLPTINTDEKINNFIDIIEELKSISTSFDLINNSNNDLDKLYNSLNTEIKPIDKNDIMWNIILDYIINTIGHTHNIKIELVDIFELDKLNNEKNNKVLKNMNKIGNIQLLWHGSRMINFCSILKNGLTLNPEKLNVFISGKMFGQGLYFASSFSKSFQYCFSNTSDKYGCLLLSKISLGNQLIKTQADPSICLNKIKEQNYNSVLGRGKYSSSEILEINNMLIPNGQLQNLNINSDLLYDEFVIYNTDQLITKYLVLVKQLN